MYHIYITLGCDERGVRICPIESNQTLLIHEVERWFARGPAVRCITFDIRYGCFPSLHPHLALSLTHVAY